MSRRMIAKTKLGLMQVNSSFAGQEYLPLSVGCLWSAYRHYGHFTDQIVLAPIVYKREDPEVIASRLQDCGIVGASLYVWNEQISLEVLRRIKTHSPETTIICGGPQVPDEASQWLETNHFVDVVVHGEGELTFVDLIDSYWQSLQNGQSTWLKDILGISWRDPEDSGAVKRNPPRPRLRDLEFPSPYLDGTFDELLSANPAESWMALWETNRGCPFSCSFCDWGSATNSKVSRFPENRIRDEIEWMSSNSIEFVFTCDANFGLLPRDVEIANWIAESAANTGYPKRVSTQGAKNVTERSFDIQQILTAAGVANGAALSMQSLNTDTLKAIKRDNISLDAYVDLQKRYREAGVPTYVDLILGLPLETLASFTTGVTELLERGQHDHIQFNNLSLLPNADINSEESRQKFEFDIVRAPVRSLHGRVLDDHENVVEEFQELVVGSSTMRGEDWVEARAFAWFVSLVHLNKLAQPLIVLSRSLGSTTYSDIFSTLIQAPSGTVVEKVVTRFRSQARETQSLGNEYFYDRDWLNVYWTADEHAFISLVASESLRDFLVEIRNMLFQHVASTSPSLDLALVSLAFDEALDIAYQSLILPGLDEDKRLNQSTNVQSVVACQLDGEQIDLVPIGNATMLIERSQDPELRHLSFEQWCRKVVWYRNKRGAYTYVVRQLVEGIPVGHFR